MGVSCEEQQVQGSTVGRLDKRLTAGQKETRDGTDMDTTRILKGWRGGVVSRLPFCGDRYLAYLCCYAGRLGTGKIDYVGQLRALANDGYQGILSLETHYAEPHGGHEQATRDSLAALRYLCQQAKVTLD